jgi:hypothetical protein
MKNAINKLSNWVLGVFVPRVDAGACVPPECCAKNRRYACLGQCTSVTKCTP